jgi:predicted RNA-binding Zn-ribbon protein involved in translation (DUF1610 family)
MTNRNPIPATLPLAELVKRAAGASGRRDLLDLLDALVARTSKGYDGIAVFQQLAAVKPNGSRLALEYVARMPGAVPPGLLLFAAQALQDKANPVGLRLAVAGKLLGSLPDNPRAVGPVVRSVTAGLSRSKTLQRMIDLQSRVENCVTLDRMVAASERTVKLKCPKCRAKLTRPAFIRHLWERHRLVFDRGAALDPRSRVEAAVSAAATADDPTAVDAVFDASPHYYPESSLEQVLQAVASRQIAAGFPVPDTLTRAAADQNAGLCPACLNPVPDPVPPVPPPLSVGAGRLSGGGYAVAVTDAPAGRTVLVTTPKEEWKEVSAAAGRFDPRLFGVLVAAPLLVVGVGLVAFVPRDKAVLAAIGVAVLGWLAYLAVRFTRKPLPAADDVAVDVAWDAVVPDLGKSKATARWLTRLCRASVNRGTPGGRVKRVYELVENAAVWADKGGPYHHLFAAVRCLQVSDEATFGKDRATGLLGVFEPFFGNELPAGYAEAVAEIVRADRLLPDADLRRFGVLLTSAAFQAGYTPSDLARVLRFLPHLRVLFGTPTADTLKASYAVWRGRHSEPWGAVGPATPVFDLAKSSPGSCRKLLAAHPDLLLRIDLPDAAAAELGEAVLTARGVVVAGKVLTDPDGEAEVSRSPRGSGWMLALGSQRINLDRKLDWDTVDLIVRWLRYRSATLLSQADALDRPNPDRIRRVLQPLAKDCPLCGATCVCRSGRVGEPWPLD